MQPVNKGQQLNSGETMAIVLSIGEIFLEVCGIAFLIDALLISMVVYICIEKYPSDVYIWVEKYFSHLRN
jgi:hypothetical protein